MRGGLLRWSPRSSFVMATKEEKDKKKKDPDRTGTTVFIKRGDRLAKGSDA